MQELDRHVAKIFNALDPGDHPRARTWGRLQLSSDSHTIDGRTQSLLVWIQDMVQVTSILSSDPTPNLRQHFGITFSTQLSTTR